MHMYLVFRYQTRGSHYVILFLVMAASAAEAEADVNREYTVKYEYIID
jgi:hypothetical protein